MEFTVLAYFEPHAASHTSLQRKDLALFKKCSAKKLADLYFSSVFALMIMVSKAKLIVFVLLCRPHYACGHQTTIGHTDFSNFRCQQHKAFADISDWKMQNRPPKKTRCSTFCDDLKRPKIIRPTASTQCVELHRRNRVWRYDMMWFSCSSANAVVVYMWIKLFQNCFRNSEV